jgi:hypothetical protein
MKDYCINQNAQPSGQHEVHCVDDCDHLPLPANRIPLGPFNSCHGAVAEAKRRFPQVNIDGCYYCSKECNHG